MDNIRRIGLAPGTRLGSFEESPSAQLRIIFCELVEQIKDVRLTSSEQLFESERPARVPHVFGDESLTALRTFSSVVEVLDGI